MPANCETGLVQSPVELQVLLSALILHYKIKKKLSKEIQLHEWITQPLLPDKAITRVKGQTCKKLLPIKLLGSFSLIQREVGIWQESCHIDVSYHYRVKMGCALCTMLPGQRADVEQQIHGCNVYVVRRRRRVERRQNRQRAEAARAADGRAGTQYY
jgi:hypothetical protein